MARAEKQRVHSLVAHVKNKRCKSLFARQHSLRKPLFLENRTQVKQRRQEQKKNNLKG